MKLLFDNFEVVHMGLFVDPHGDQYEEPILEQETLESDENLIADYWDIRGHKPDGGDMESLTLLKDEKTTHKICDFLNELLNAAR